MPSVLWPMRNIFLGQLSSCGLQNAINTFIESIRILYYITIEFSSSSRRTWMKASPIVSMPNTEWANEADNFTQDQFRSANMIRKAIIDNMTTNIITGLCNKNHTLVLYTLIFGNKNLKYRAIEMPSDANMSHVRSMIPAWIINNKKITIDSIRFDFI